ncbi:MAG TPA: NUDIX domain-containing protein [Allosphingosinicella sp.]|jgi:predicted NUDIX family NTP pyrophosphohydrolase
MAEFSAGILLYRHRGEVVEVLLIHPGGPYWRNKDKGAWMIPKGGVEPGEEPAACALREFEEELGTRLKGELRPLCGIRQKGGKWVEAFLMEGDLDADYIVSNHFQIEVPPRSGRFRSYPEVDRAAWFGLPDAREYILPSQSPILDAFEATL